MTTTQSEICFDEPKAAQLRDEGINRAAHANERREPGWQDRAVEMFAGFNRAFFQTCEFADWCYARGLSAPREGRAWGAVAVRLRKAGRIAFSHFEPCSAANQHKCPRSVWRQIA